MTTISLPEAPYEGQIVNITAEKKLQYAGGRWKIFTNNLPMTPETASLQRPIHAAEAPSHPSVQKLWLKMPEMRLHYEYYDGNTYIWVPVEPLESSSSPAAGVLDLSLSTVFVKTVTGEITFSIQNPHPAGMVNSFVLELINGGSATVSWFSNIHWTGGTPPTLTAAGKDILGFYSVDGGASWRGFILSKDSKPAGV